MGAASKWIWEPGRAWIEATNVQRFLRRLGLAEREEFLEFSRNEPERFWDAMVRETGIEWFEPYSKVLDDSRGPEWCRWFEGGKLNIAHNCLDRHRLSPRPAIIWERESGESGEVSFAELYETANRLAAFLTANGLKAGDRVALVMPMVPEIAAILYACLKLGLIVVPVFAGFGAAAIASRLADSGARVVFTADCTERRGKRVAIAEKVEQARAKAPGVERVVVYQYGGGGWGGLLEGMGPEPVTRAMESESAALLLYTSGTTGKPKGCVHTHAGALAQVAKEIWLGFDHKDEDRFFWLTDIGWMMGPWTILGNHNFGGTVVLYDGAPDYPGPERLWRVIERHGVTTFGVSPTAIRVLMKSGGADGYAMETLRLLGSTGEPWDETSYRWFFEQVGKRRCPVINISGGTEILGCFLMPLPIQPLKACTLGSPAPGMAVEVVDEAGKPVRGRQGYLVCTKPAPSMTRGVWGDAERYLEAYWSRYPGWWWHGDWASVDEDGCWFLHGRADESMNVSGRKVGPAEVEEALMECAGVTEAAVIGAPDEVKGEAIVCFVVMKPGARFDGEAIAKTVGEALGAAFRPRAVYEVGALPKTQSGKIVRRLIRARYLGEEPGDTSSVENPAALDAIRAREEAGR